MFGSPYEAYRIVCDCRGISSIESFDFRASPEKALIVKEL